MDDILSKIHPRARQFVEAVGAKVISLEDFDVLVGGMRKNDKIAAFVSTRGQYNPGRDLIVINMLADNPLLTRTVLHELGHWSGHSTRLRRPVIAHAERNVIIKDGEYDTEEIVAEMIAYKLGEDMGILTDAWKEKSARYIAEYRKGSEHEARIYVKQAVWFLVNIAMPKLRGS